MMRAVSNLSLGPFRRNGRSLIDQHDDESVMTTEIRRLARNIQYAQYSLGGKSETGAIPLIRTVLFTSAQPHEGKSFITGLLGITLAKDHPKMKILIVDGDLRQPRQHELFLAPFRPGLSDVLQNDHALGTAIRQLELPNLFLLPSGGVMEKSPERLLAAETTRDLLNACSGFFDMILVDTPPIVPVNDASVLAPYTDGVVLVVMARRAMRNEVEHAIELVRASRGKLLGVVVNKVNHSHQHYGYYTTKERYVAQARMDSRR